MCGQWWAGVVAVPDPLCALPGLPVVPVPLVLVWPVVLVAVGLVSVVIAAGDAFALLPEPLAAIAGTAPAAATAAIAPAPAASFLSLGVTELLSLDCHRTGGASGRPRRGP
jgi:hypothetical protein